MKKTEPMGRHSVFALAITLAAASAQPALAQSPVGPLESEFLFEILLDVDAQFEVGDVRIAPVTGGTFSGPGLRGTVRTGGEDYLTTVSGHTSQDVHITLDTDDGAVIYMTYTGIIARGDGGTYWTTRPIFHTSSEKYDWLNHIVCVGKNKRVQGKVAYDVFRIL